MIKQIYDFILNHWTELLGTAGGIAGIALFFIFSRNKLFKSSQINSGDNSVNVITGGDIRNNNISNKNIK